MDTPGRTIDHLSAVTVEIINGFGYQQFVAGNGISRNNPHIARQKPHLAVFIQRHPGQSRQLLALGAGSNDQHLIHRIAVHFLHLNHGIPPESKISHLGGDTDHIAHAASHHGNLAATGFRRPDGLLHPVNIGGKCG
ncbi:hypothetical protein SDC9_192436 [bioreactor metagenome]|uniref:Uncharacterized protein n=1 Tax=bioreactor metagenome TaxID=1076179 RepID=A0A645I344_9ZZZZ